MDSIFLTQDRDKMERIISSSLEIFARDGYEKASTNEIVEKAGISKGLLFHYFGSKRKLWTSINDFCYDHILGRLNREIDWSESDLLERAGAIAALKISAMQDHPGIFEFMKRSLTDGDDYLMQKFLKDETVDLSRRMYTENIDFSLFRTDIPIETMIDIIRFTMEGVSETIRTSPSSSLGEMREVMARYIHALRMAYYR